MSWIFQGTANRMKRDYYAAVAQDWLSAEGANSRRLPNRRLKAVS